MSVKDMQVVEKGVEQRGGGILNLQFFVDAISEWSVNEMIQSWLPIKLKAQQGRCNNRIDKNITVQSN